MDPQSPSLPEGQQELMENNRRVYDWTQGMPSQPRFEPMRTWFDDKEPEKKQSENPVLEKQPPNPVEEEPMPDTTPSRTTKAAFDQMEKAVLSMEEEVDPTVPAPRYSVILSTETRRYRIPDTQKDSKTNLFSSVHNFMRAHAPDSFLARANTAKGKDRLLEQGITVTQDNSHQVLLKANGCVIAEKESRQQGEQQWSQAQLQSQQGNSRPSSDIKEKPLPVLPIEHFSQEAAEFGIARRSAKKVKARTSQFIDEEVDLFQEETHKPDYNFVTASYPKKSGKLCVVTEGIDDDKVFPSDGSDDDDDDNDDHLSNDSFIIDFENFHMNYAHDNLANNSNDSGLQNLNIHDVEQDSYAKPKENRPVQPPIDFHTNDKNHWHLLGLTRNPTTTLYPALETLPTANRTLRHPTSLEIDAGIAEAYLNPHPPPRPRSLFHLTPSEASARTANSLRSGNGTYLVQHNFTARHPPATPHLYFRNRFYWQTPHIRAPPIPIFPYPHGTTRCRSRHCPLKFKHEKGPYLHEGKLRTREEGHVFGASNPPPEIWDALDRIKDENGELGGKGKEEVSAADVKLVSKFVRLHYADEMGADEMGAEEEEGEDGEDGKGRWKWKNGGSIVGFLNRL